jgi:hypothetical protein
MGFTTTECGGRPPIAVPKELESRTPAKDMPGQARQALSLRWFNCCFIKALYDLQGLLFFMKWVPYSRPRGIARGSPLCYEGQAGLDDTI